MPAREFIINRTGDRQGRWAAGDEVVRNNYCSFPIAPHPATSVVAHAAVDPRPPPPSWQRGRTYVRLRGRADARLRGRPCGRPKRSSNSCPCGSSRHLHGAPGSTRASKPQRHIPVGRGRGMLLRRGGTGGRGLGRQARRDHGILLENNLLTRMREVRDRSSSQVSSRKS